MWSARAYESVPSFSVLIFTTSKRMVLRWAVFALSHSHGEKIDGMGRCFLDVAATADDRALFMVLVALLKSGRCFESSQTAIVALEIPRTTELLLERLTLSAFPW